MKIYSIIILMVFGLSSGAYAQQREAKPHTSTLTASNVLAITDSYVRQQGFDLEFYPNRKPEYRSDRDEWHVCYNRNPNRHPGDHFVVYVHDKTKKVRLFGGV